MAKGQLTLFGVLIVVLIMTVALYTITTPVPFLDDEDSVLAATTKQFVESCLENAAQGAIIVTGLQGGHHVIPDSLIYPDYVHPVTYYQKQQTLLVPSQTQYERDLASLTKQGFDRCFEDRALTDLGYELEHEDSVITTLVSEQSTRFALTFPITIRQGEDSAALEKFEHTENVRLGTIHNVILQFYTQQDLTKEGPCISCLLELSQEHNLYTYVQTMDPSTMLFTIIDTETPVAGEPLLFSFAAEFPSYSCSNLPPDADFFFLKDCIDEQIGDQEVSLGDVPDFTIGVGEELRHELDVSGQEVTYESSFDAVSVQDNTLLFIPTPDHVGTHTVRLEATNQLGNQDFSVFTVEVSP